MIDCGVGDDESCLSPMAAPRNTEVGVVRGISQHQQPSAAKRERRETQGDRGTQRDTEAHRTQRHTDRQSTAVHRPGIGAVRKGRAQGRCSGRERAGPASAAHPLDKLLRADRHSTQAMMGAI